jgi:hypothetical protein
MKQWHAMKFCYFYKRMMYLLLLFFLYKKERTVETWFIYFFIEDACDVEEVLVLQSWKWLLYMKALRKRLCHWKFVFMVTYPDRNVGFVSSFVLWPSKGTQDWSSLQAWTNNTSNCNVNTQHESRTSRLGELWRRIGVLVRCLCVGGLAQERTSKLD